jgi:hypothetical protein
MPERSVRVKVVWDTDDDEGECSLPEVVGVPEHVVEAEEDGAVADWLSDEYGWCVRELSFIDDAGESAAEPE